MLHKVNKAAAAVLDHLKAEAEKCPDEYKHCKISNNPGYMPVTVEIIAPDQISICHYGELNGDAMRDPEIVYWMKDGEYYPCETTMDYTGTYRRLITFDENGEPCRYMPAWQKDAAEFSGLWMRNIMEQQNLKGKITPRPSKPLPPWDMRRIIAEAKKAAKQQQREFSFS